MVDGKEVKCRIRNQTYLFEVYDRKFLFDVDTNSVVSIPDDVYSFLGELACCSSDVDVNSKLETMDDKVKRGITYLENQGLLHPVNSNLQVKHIETDILQELFNGNLSLMTLQITQNCNGFQFEWNRFFICRHKMD